MSEKARYDIIGHKNLWFAVSGVMLLAGIISLFVFGLNLGIDFTGGTIYDLRFPETVAIDQIRETLDEQGLKNAVIQKTAEKDIFIRTKIMNKDEQEALVAKLSQEHGQAEVQRIEMVGPVIGEQLTKQSLLALLIASVGIVIYVSVRFELKFAVASILAILHDVLIVIGIFSILQKEIDVTFVAAILTIVGYSINDTIVIFDRIRENLRHKSKKESLKDLMNRSIYQSLTRSIYTPLTVLFTLVSLYIFGGETLSNFTLAMILGVLVGTYSSIFNASPLVELWTEKIEGRH
ncbi:MAG: protein translocase subunit SecF [bacterium]